MGAHRKVIAGGVMACSKCGEIKSLDQFYRCSQASTGRSPSCKVCYTSRYGESRKKYKQTEKYKESQKVYQKTDKCKAAVKKYRQTEKGKAVQKKRQDRYAGSEKGRATLKRYVQSEEGKAVRARYGQTPQYKESIKKRGIKYNFRNPEKILAHKKLSYAVRSGKIDKPKNCSRCCAEGKLDGHHEDYSKPLDVVWVCRLCHSEIHRGVTHG